jgi:HlyD family secretion protein
MSKRSKILIAVASGLVLIGLIAWRGFASQRIPKSQIEVAKLERGRIVAKVTATGTLSAIVTIQVGSQVSGRIADE